MRKVLFGIGIVLSFFYLVGCSFPFSSSSETTSTLQTLSELIQALPDVKADIPPLFKDDSSSRSVGSRAVTAFDSSGQESVIGSGMGDLMINVISDLNKTDARESVIWSRVFINFLKENTPIIASGGYDTDIDLGTKDFPAGTYGPYGETSMDWGTVRLTKLSPTQTEARWTLGELGDFNKVYIRLLFTLLHSSNLEAEMWIVADTGSTALLNFYYNYCNDKTGKFEVFMKTPPDSTPWFITQYTDEEGYLRTVLNHESPDGTGGLSMMLGSDTSAGIVEFWSELNPEPTSDFLYSNSLEVYGSTRQLMKNIFSQYSTTPTSIELVDGGVYQYNYPLAALTKSGYTLMHDDSATTHEYWMDKDNEGSHDAYEAVNAEVSLGMKVGQDMYQQWDAANETSTDLSIDCYSSDTDLPAVFDNSTQITEMESLLINWYDSEKGNLGHDYTYEVGFPSVADINNNWPPL